MLRTLPKLVVGLRNRHFLIIDVLIFVITPILALAIRLEDSFDLDPYQFGLVLVTVMFLTVKLTVLYTGGFYKRYWRYAGIDELQQMIVLMVTAVVLQTIFFKGFYSLTDLSIDNLPRSLPLLDGMLSCLLVGVCRFSVPATIRLKQFHPKFYRRDRVLIVGAGNAGVALVKEMQQSPWIGLYPIAFIDDNPEKQNLHIHGVPVVGSRDKIPQIVRCMHISRVIIAMPLVPGRVIREILEICHVVGVPTSTLPGINEILNAPINVGSVREVQIEDLLRREPIQTDIEKVSQFLKGKKVLITGAGGSIGSELCRQILKCRPAQIVLVGHGENSVFNIQQELAGVLQILKKEGAAQGYIPDLDSFIGDIRFRSRLKFAFEKYKPQIVFHAAAHKHVPLMELNAPEAIANNVRGTNNLLDLSLEYNVEHFVMISTDKAVNPTNIMGASKRVAEILVLQAAQKSKKPFVVVRFGNVLGSRGSVVPTFKRQIAQGGPITITHPEICRYFMTIPEAVQLVLQAAVIGRGGEVFMLDMGQPVKIVDLAKDLIRLSGYEVGKDIEIVFTGLRPGEKLFEELFIPGEKYERTQHNKILRVGNASHIVRENIDLEVAALCKAAEQNDTNLIVFLLEQLLPEYMPGYSTVDLHTEVAKDTINTAKHRLESSVKSGSLTSAQTEKDLQRAFEREEFRIHYQPIISLQTDQLIGFEALLRWQHPTRGLISAAEFIRVAEATDLIIPIGWWVLREACRQMRTWQVQFPVKPPLTISVNLTRKQFFQPELSKRITQILKETHLDASTLRLEIPEGMVKQNSELANAVFLKLKGNGVQLHIDNCGFSNSSLIYPDDLANLKYGNFNSLKLDRSVVSRIDTGNGNLDSLQKIITLADELGMGITATGIETAGQNACLKSLKCLYGQGNFFSKPLEGKAAKTLIEAKAIPNR